MVDRIDSNATGLAIAEEVAGSPKYLPGDPNPAGGNFAGTAIWYGREPNTYKDFGGDFKNVARNPITQSRQRLKGSVVDLDAAGGWNEDLTMNNLQRALRGFVFAAAREKPDTASYDGTPRAITSVTAGTKTYAAAAGLGGFLAKMLVLASGFTNAGNNGIKTVASSTAGTVVTSEALVDEGAPPAAARLQVVGAQFAAGDVTFDWTNPVPTLGSIVFDFTTLGLIRGEWIFIGDDANAAYSFATAGLRGYARILSVAAHAIVFDKTTFTPATDAGAAKTIRIFFGKVIKNESDPNLIVQKSFQLERQLGNDGVGIQSEYLKGAFGDQLDLTSPKSDKANIDLSFMCMDYETRDGATGVKAGTRVAGLGEEAINTSSNLYRARLALVDPATLNPTALFAYVTDFKVTVKNNVSLDKAQSVLGAIGVTKGNFEVGGNISAYFTKVAAVAAIKAFSDVTLDFIYAVRNSAMVFDFPLISIAGRITPVKDQPIMMPLDNQAFKGAGDYTMLANFLPYVPNAGMATGS